MCLLRYSINTFQQLEFFFCDNGYHLLNCETMYCVDSFKRPQSYCLAWELVCDGHCDCRNCEEESVCDHVTCPGMLLYETSLGKLKCKKNNFIDTDDKHSALIQTTAQRQPEEGYCMCSPIVYTDLMNGSSVADYKLVFQSLSNLIFCNITHFGTQFEDIQLLKSLVKVQWLDLRHNKLKSDTINIFGNMTQLIFLDLSFKPTDSSFKLLCMCNIRIESTADRK